MLQQRFAVDAAPSRGDIRLLAFSTEIEGAVRRHGLAFYMVCDFPTISRPHLSENLIATNWPDELLKLNAGGNFLIDSRLIEGLKKSIMPVMTNAPLFSPARTRCELIGMYVCDRFKDTIAVSLYDAHRQHYALILSGPSSVADCDVGSLVLELMRALDNYADASAQQRLLTTRELECLSWSAAGKSSDETAVILDLSSHTVTGYLKTAMQKLDAVTRTQAVAAAIRLGLI